MNTRGTTKSWLDVPHLAVSFSGMMPLAEGIPGTLTRGFYRGRPLLSLQDVTRGRGGLAKKSEERRAPPGLGCRTHPRVAPGLTRGGSLTLPPPSAASPGASSDPLASFTRCSRSRAKNIQFARRLPPRHLPGPLRSSVPSALLFARKSMISASITITAPRCAAVPRNGRQAARRGPVVVARAGEHGGDVSEALSGEWPSNWSIASYEVRPTAPLGS